MNDFAFKLYLFFVVSWFLQLPSRFPVLGAIRFDFVLILILFTLLFLQKRETSPKAEGQLEIENWLKILFLYFFFTIPLVEWPGSVLRSGIPNFVKGVVFFFFTVHFITSKNKLKTFMIIFLGVQVFRILEPLYLHYTVGYWGSKASVSGGLEFMGRLSGAPHDVINPNGLAFLVVLVLPFIFFAMRENKRRFLLFLLVPFLVQALMLTGSRTGFLGLFILLLTILYRSSRKIIIGMVVTIGTVFVFQHLSADLVDRYTSIYDDKTKNASTFQGRIDGVMNDFKVALQKPIFGHGLGSSKEANWNKRSKGQPSHNLYMEVFQELGLVGLVIFLCFLWTVIRNFRRLAGRLQKQAGGEQLFVIMINAMSVWLIVQLLYTMASYGLSMYQWYLFAGLTVVLDRLQLQERRAVTATA